MIRGEHLRAARALLGWSQGDLALRAGIGLATLQRIERVDDEMSGNFRTLAKVQATLERAGIQFLGLEVDATIIGVSILLNNKPRLGKKR